jgi:hypothetical protein
MRMLNEEELAEYYKNANIHQSIDAGHAIIHIGDIGGLAFVLVNDIHGYSVLTEGM